MNYLTITISLPPGSYNAEQMAAYLLNWNHMDKHLAILHDFELKQGV